MRQGLRSEVSLVVGDGDTAVALGSGDVPVLGTPRLVALAEEATVEAVRGHLGAGETTVGTRVEVRHLAASPVGARVTAEAELGRVVVDRARFLARVGGQ